MTTRITSRFLTTALQTYVITLLSIQEIVKYGNVQGFTDVEDQD